MLSAPCICTDRTQGTVLFLSYHPWKLLGKKKDNTGVPQKWHLGGGNGTARALTAGANALH